MLFFNTLQSQWGPRVVQKSGVSHLRCDQQLLAPRGLQTVTTWTIPWLHPKRKLLGVVNSFAPFHWLRSRMCDPPWLDKELKKTTLPTLRGNTRLCNALTFKNKSMRGAFGCEVQNRPQTSPYALGQNKAAPEGPYAVRK